MSLKRVDGVLVGPYPERLGASLVEGGELGEFGKHPEMVETTGHSPRLSVCGILDEGGHRGAGDPDQSSGLELQLEPAHPA